MSDNDTYRCDNPAPPATMRIVIEVDDTPEDETLRAQIVERVRHRLSYGVKWFDAEANRTHEVLPDRVYEVRDETEL